MISQALTPTALDLWHLYETLTLIGAVSVILWTIASWVAYGIQSRRSRVVSTTDLRALSNPGQPARPLSMPARKGWHGHQVADDPDHRQRLQAAITVGQFGRGGR